MEQRDMQAFIDAYVAQWNETDTDLRHEAVRGLWAGDAVDYTAANIYRGHEDIEKRIARSNEKYVQNGGYTFRLKGTINGIQGAVRLYWEMIKDDEISATGLDLLILNAEGLVEAAYQFIEG